MPRSTGTVRKRSVKPEDETVRRKRVAQEGCHMVYMLVERKKKRKKNEVVVSCLVTTNIMGNICYRKKVYKNVCCIRDKIVEREGKKKPVPDSPLSGQVADSRQEPSGAGLNCRCSRPRDMPDKAR